MDFLTIIGLLSNLITLEEGGYSLCSRIKRALNRKGDKKIKLIKWDSDDENGKKIIAQFKEELEGKYKNHIFSQSEKEEILAGLLESREDLQIDENEKEKIRNYVFEILEKCNKYNKSLMSDGDLTILDRIDQIADENNKNNTLAFYKAIHNSKTIRFENIENTLNGEYSIDKSRLINKIEKEGHQFVSIQGEAGCGKSALCKTMLINEEIVLFAKSEEFIKASHLREIWDCDLELAFKEFSNHKIYIYIDALEYIAGYSNDKFSILQELYDISSSYQNVHIITSCRTIDGNAFLKIHTKYAVEIYEIEEVSDDELLEIARRYPVIAEMKREDRYDVLLKNLFYINMVISKGITINDISSESTFRDYIWNNIICLNNKASEYGIEQSDVYNTINKIAFERAKNFNMGIRKLEVKTSLLNALKSEGVVVVENELVKLKYDIYEDICFEKYFDREFEDCKSNLGQFYEFIASLGPCVYRRYQIWIANKLFIKESREKFIQKMIFSSEIDEKWQKQTKIGIVKSKYCETFFEEYFDELIEKKLLEEFIDIINLYAFEAKMITIDDGNSLQLKPVGKARETLIKMISEKKFYLEIGVNQESIVKMCLDYAENPTFDKTSLATCEIVEYYLKKEIECRADGWYYSAEERLERYLTIEYLLAEYSNQWINAFLEQIKKMYVSKDHREKRWASDVSMWTLDHAYPALTKYCGDSLCSLAMCVFFKNESEYTIGTFYDLEEQYGLSQNASDSNMSSNKKFKYFPINLCWSNLTLGLKWAIDFTNKAFEFYNTRKSNDISEVVLYFPDSKSTKIYYGSANMWLCGVQECVVPYIISDIVYYTKEAIISQLEYAKSNSKLLLEIGTRIKEVLYSESNNIAMLTIVREIGLHFKKELPGYAVDLASSYDLLIWDIQRYLLYHQSTAQKILKNTMLQTVGIPEFKERYSLDSECDLSIQDYVLMMQLNQDKSYCEKVVEVIDYLYSIAEDNTIDDKLILQAKKMDLRNPLIRDLGNGLIEISASIPSTNNNVDIEKEKNDEIIEQIGININQVFMQASSDLDTIDYEKVDECINNVICLIEKDEVLRIQYENVLVRLISISLCNKLISFERRNELCNIWADGINKIFYNQTFVADNCWLPVLFRQLDFELSGEVKNKIKEILIYSIIYNSGNGQIRKISDYANCYLSTNKSLAQSVFNTIINLAEIDRKKEEEYEKCKKEIIEKYLFREMPYDFSATKFGSLDIQMLCHIVKSGLRLENNQMYFIMKCIINYMIDLWSKPDASHNWFRKLGVYEKYEIVQFFQKEITNIKENFEKVLEILFEDIDFNKFSMNTIELYLEIFGTWVYQYFDAYKDENIRLDIEKKIKILEKKIDSIHDDYVKTNLYKTVAMFYPQYYPGLEKLKTLYSDRQKMFLNKQYSKFGHYHLKDYLYTIYLMNIQELLPEALLSANKVLTNSRNDDFVKYKKIVLEHKWIIDILIINAYTYNSEKIKKDEELTNAFISILEMMIELKNEKAAVILDEFMIH